MIILVHLFVWISSPMFRHKNGYCQWPLYHFPIMLHLKYFLVQRFFLSFFISIHFSFFNGFVVSQFEISSIKNVIRVPFVCIYIFLPINKRQLFRCTTTVPDILRNPLSHHASKQRTVCGHLDVEGCHSTTNPSSNTDQDIQAWLLAFPWPKHLFR